MKFFAHSQINLNLISSLSGGPLQIYNDKQAYCTYALIGVVSFGLKQCGTEGKPGECENNFPIFILMSSLHAVGVYVNVYHYLDWIEGIVWK